MLNKMLNQAAFEYWCTERSLTKEARELIMRIRSSPPSRLVQGRAGNVSGRYPSHKMGCSIQFESHRDELALIYKLEHDPNILEFYDQPGKIKLTYLSKSGRQVGVLHTPDFFVLRTDGCGWIECKMEDNLVRLAGDQPHRYSRDSAGKYFSPPGEAYAKKFGLFYLIRSSKEIEWVFLRNLRFLEEYLRFSLIDVPQKTILSIRAQLMSMPGITLKKLLQALPSGSADAVYKLIVTEQIYVDLEKEALPEAERVHVFPDKSLSKNQYSAHIILVRPLTMHELTVGVSLTYDGRPWTVINAGMSEIALLSEEKKIIHISIVEVEKLLQQGRLARATSLFDERKETIRTMLTQAHPKDLEIAWKRYQFITSNSKTQIPLSNTTRTLRRWRALFQKAEIVYGNGFVGLLPKSSKKGNREKRLSDDVEQLMETYIAGHYETIKQHRKWEVYLLFKREAEQKNLPVPSYSTFRKRIKNRSREKQIYKRQGLKAAAQIAAWYWELERTTPKHGDRPWDIVHLDHTLLDIELVSSRTGRKLGRPWATFLTDAFSRRLLVAYLTFDAPSYRSCMMTLRDCVSRYNRLPQTIIVDGGSDFHSTYFETLLAYYSCTKATRPYARPHFGSVCERLFGTANTTFIHNLLGNTQITKNIRQMTKAVNPKLHAIWTLGDLYQFLIQWGYDVYDRQIHPALGMTPRDAFTTGLVTGGARSHVNILYDEEFRFLSLPTTPRGTAKVQSGRGVQLNYIYYWSNAFKHPSVEDCKVPIRYDPFDIGTAYAFVQGSWVKCLSEYYLQLQGHSEKELKLASAELRKRYQNHKGESSITAKRLADFLFSAETHENILIQRQHDLESRAVFSHMKGLFMHDGEVEIQLSPTPLVENTLARNLATETMLDKDLGKLEAYEEYH